MAKPKTDIKEIDNLAPDLLSPDLWNLKSHIKETKIHLLQLINEGLEASEIIHQTRIWKSNRRNGPENHKEKTILNNTNVKLSTGRSIGMKDTLKLPPYRRGISSPKSTISPVELPPKTNIPPSQLSQWLSTIDEGIRAQFLSWCAKNGKIAGRKTWNEFELQILNSQTQNLIIECQEEYDNSEEQPTFDQRIYKNDNFIISKTRTAQGSFRKDVLANWGNRCAITLSAFALDACHIISHSSGGAPSVENGIALAADLHRLLDAGHLRIICNRVEFSDHARIDPRYSIFHDTQLRKPVTAVFFEEPEI